MATLTSMTKVLLGCHIYLFDIVLICVFMMNIIVTFEMGSYKNKSINTTNKNHHNRGNVL